MSTSLTPGLLSSRPLVGRKAELEALFGLADRLPQRGGALVVRGEPGVGKTSLLNAVSERAIASGARVLTAAGVPAEADVPFSGVHQLLLPLLSGGDGPGSSPAPAVDGRPTSYTARGCLEGLPKPQRDAVAIALGLEVGAAPPRLLVGLALLTMLSEAAEARPLLCVLDDVHWFDRASAQALAFAGRRLMAESVLMVFASSEPNEELHGLPELAVEGLADGDARALLASVVQGPLDERVRDRIVAETRGNPLALLELPRGLSPAQLAGGFGLPTRTPASGPLSSQIEESFLRRVEELPADTRTLLLLAAAEPVGDVALQWRAAEQLGIGYEVLRPAVADGLIEAEGRVRFRHPLVRSAIYRAASLVDRERVHRALADATDPDVDPDRRAWHRALATSGPDEEVAAELERSAGRAQARAGLAAAAAFLERAVGLTLDPAVRTQRALAAARAKYEAAAIDSASDLLAIAELGSLDQLQRARLERLRAQIGFARTGSANISGLTVGPEAPGLLLDAAKRLEQLDPQLARETYLDAMTTALWTGSKSGGCGLRVVAEAVRRAPPGAQPMGMLDLVLDGLAARFTEPYAVAVPALSEALRALARGEGDDGSSPRWLWYACPVTPEPLAPELWDDAAWHELATRAVREARDAGALSVLPSALTYRACLHVLEGEFLAATALIDEAYAILEATGSAPLRYPSLLLAAWRGREAEALKTIEAGIQDATARGFDRPIGFARLVTAVLYNGLGRYHDALLAAQEAAAHEDLGFLGFALSEMVEAAVRTDQREVASDALAQLAERTSAARTDWALGIEARARALLTEGEAAELLYRQAIEHQARTRVRVELARAHLHYGEWLRREHRRVDARQELRTAHEMFTTIGMEAFAERAQAELLATGEHVRKRGYETRDELTAQEVQIARLARDGLSNSAIGTQLFISPRTVEWHLGNVFAKLEISSRRELAKAMPSDSEVASR